jgi:hypothetical protein
MTDHQDEKPKLPYAVHPRVQNGSVCLSVVFNGELVHDIAFSPAAARAIGAEFFQCAAEAEDQKSV